MNTSTAPRKPGDLDESFGLFGSIVGPADGIVKSIVAAADDKLTLAVQISNQNAFEIHRLLSEGRKDPDFGNDGVVTAQFGNDGTSMASRLIQRDEKIWLIGDLTSGDGGVPAITRRNADGSPDLIFGTKLLSAPATSSNRFPSDGCLQADGKLLVLSARIQDSGTTIKGVLTRLLSNGENDSEFGVDGQTEVTFGDQQSSMVNVIVQPDGKIVVGGNYSGGDGNQIALMQFDPNGTLDKTFGDNGRILYGHNHSLAHLSQQADGKLLCAGTGDSAALLMRFTANGRVDTTFNGGREVLANLGEPQGGVWRALVIQADGKIVAAGWNASLYQKMFCGRLNPDGTWDPSFANEGWGEIRDIPGTPYSATIQSQSRIIVAGSRIQGYFSVVAGIQN
ncbi:delta-60 repeat domain-containing protein [Pseudomonas kribbensis]|jgi:uncharacterized delta-60 repeat protein|uniref:delta-60 repeat domain-containing protein n=1 Tax=Pseudomonas TaxID=286 RepID=UPI00200FFF8E|nr:delta-60 repeat domain-containing protein [Pseudomonas sp. MWU12-2029]